MTVNLETVHEDGDLLVVNKPAGVVCHGAPAGADSLIDRVRGYLDHREGRLVNRLDRETSGLVLVAKRADVARELGVLFAAGGVEKTYQAIVHGELLADLTIDEPVGPAVGSAVAVRDAVRPDGSPARTEVRPRRVCRVAGGVFTLVDVVPRTGRKHQIRIHLAHAGFPVVGDKIYGPDETIYLRFVSRSMTEADARALVLPHHALHAARLAFVWRGRAHEYAVEPDAVFRAFASAGGSGAEGVDDEGLDTRSGSRA